MVVVDTGTSYISGPTSSLKLIMQALGAKEKRTNEVRDPWGELGGGKGCQTVLGRKQTFALLTPPTPLNVRHVSHRR